MICSDRRMFVAHCHMIAVSYLDACDMLARCIHAFCCTFCGSADVRHLHVLMSLQIIGSLTNLDQAIYILLFLPTPEGCCCSLTGRVGVKLLNGSVAYTAAGLSPDPNANTLSDSETTFACSGPQPVLLSGSPPLQQQHGSQSPKSLLSQTPAKSLLCQTPVAVPALLRPSLLGPFQSRPSFQADTADLGVSKAKHAGSSLLPPQTVVDQVLDEDVNDDDAFDAICDLDALLAPPSLHRPAPALSHDLIDTRPSSVRAHTSTAHSSRSQDGQYSPTQTYSPKKGGARRTVAAPSNQRCLWAGDQQTAVEAALTSAPMRILKRPVISDQQASPNAVSPPLAATSNVPTACISRAIGASAGVQLISNSTVEPAGSPISSNNESPMSTSGLEYLQGQQSIPSSTALQAVHSSNGSTSKAAFVATVSPSDKPASAMWDAARCTRPSASMLSTAGAISPDFSSRDAVVSPHINPVHQLVMELQEQPLLTETSASQVSYAGSALRLMHALP